MKSIAILLPAFAVALVAGCSKHEPQAGSDVASLPAVKVQTLVLRPTTSPSLIDVMGTVRPERHAAIAAKIMGAIEEMPVVLGQRVHKGDLLVKIAASEINAKVLQAQSQLNLARRDLDRERSLLPKGASTAETVKALADRYAMTEAMVREAEAMLAYTEVRAPFDGVVARKMASLGDLAAPGYPLLELEGTNDFHVEAGIPDSLVSGLSVGMPLTVDLPATHATVEGRLIELSSAADPYARTVAVKIALPAGASVRSGEFARVKVPGSPETRLLVPCSAVSRVGQMVRVYVAVNGKSVLRLVRLGGVTGTSVNVLAGLDAGDRVIVNPPVGFVEGRALEVTP